MRPLARYRLAEEMMPPGHQHGNELAPESAGVSIGRQCRVHVITDEVRVHVAPACQLVLGDLARIIPRRSASRRAAGEGKAGEGKLADAAPLIEYDAAQVRSAPFAAVGARAQIDDARNVALTFLRLACRAALKIDGKRQAVEAVVGYDRAHGGVSENRGFRFGRIERSDGGYRVAEEKSRARDAQRESPCAPEMPHGFVPKQSLPRPRASSQS